MKINALAPETVGDAILSIREKMDAPTFLSALAVALASSFAASLLYRFFYERRGTGSQIHRAFPLLSLAVTTLFIGVQLSIPLSLGLLGSLSIIRFRTPIKEPEEVGFIMLVIASAICAATFNFAFILYLYAFALLALVAARGASLSRFLRRDGMLILTLPAAEAAAKTAAIQTELDANFTHLTLDSASTRNGMTTLQYVFSGLRGGDAPTLHAKLSAIADFAAVNLFLDRPGGLR